MLQIFWLYPPLNYGGGGEVLSLILLLWQIHLLVLLNGVMGVCLVEQCRATLFFQHFQLTIVCIEEAIVSVAKV